MTRINPFDTLSLEPERGSYSTTVRCRRCDKVDTMMGYQPNTVVFLDTQPPPTLVCTCGCGTAPLCHQCADLCFHGAVFNPNCLACLDRRWFVYMVECSDGSLYTGITKNVEARVACHSSGQGAKYTRGRGPVKLVYTEQVVGKSKALKREHAIKKLPRAKKLELVK